MKRIISDLKNHIASDFQWKHYGPLLVLLSILIFVNYYFDIEGTFLAGLENTEYLLYFIILYPTVYYSAVWLKSGSHVFTTKFLLVSGIFLIALAISSGFIYYRDWVLDFPVFERYYLRNLFSNAQGSFWIFVPLALVYYLGERRHMNSFYGLSFRNHNFRPYTLLILFMVPLMIAATQLPGFLETYPTLKVWQYEEVFGLSHFQMGALYEVLYLSDFIRVETLFRGALVIGLARFLGRDSIVIMSTLYCVLHFNKPLGETISSFFGGYLLGTIAYYQQNIIGGCIVHAGIAGLMELIAYIAWTFWA